MRKRSIVLILLLLVVATPVIYLWIKSQPTYGNYVMLTNANVITMKNEGSEHTAIVVKNGKVAAVGDQHALSETHADADIIDMQGSTILPGLIEPHAHPMAASMLGQTIDVSGFTHRSRAEVIATLEQALDGPQLTPWIVAYGWDPVMIDDLTPPTLAELDALSPDKPLLILTQMMHDAYANSAALEAAGITKDTPNPTGGEFIRDAEGNLTGTVRETSAIHILSNAIPKPPEGIPDLLLNRQYQLYAAAGYTAVGVLGPVSKHPRPLQLMESLADGAAIRVVAYGLPEHLEHKVPPRADHKFKVQGVKFWMDGSPFAGGAAFKEPYENSPLIREKLHLPHNHLAGLNYGAEEFAAMINKYHQQGIQIAIHVQGERAIDQALDAVEAALQKTPRTDHRHRMEHNALITQAQLARAQQLGVTTSFFVDHVYYYGHALPDIVGNARLARYMPVKAAFDAGHKATLHTDNPATPLAPFRVMQTALTRRSQQQPTVTGRVIGADQAISKWQALQTLTINAAWQLGMEKTNGSIETGKLADFTIIDRNPLTTPTNEWRDIQVLATWVDGQPIDTSKYTLANLCLLGKVIWKMAGWYLLGGLILVFLLCRLLSRRRQR